VVIEQGLTLTPRQAGQSRHDPSEPSPRQRTGTGTRTRTCALGGLLQVAVFTWIQRRVQPAMLGRAMSLFMFIFMGLAPVSAAATGWLLRSVPLSLLFRGGGALLVTIVVVAWLATPMRQVSDAPAAVG
jgi:hypothetical protein